MRVVTYARVSTIGQESKGESLQNQEAAFARWLGKTGSARAASYKEAASAGTVAGRLEFQRMLDELPRTKPQAIVVDTLDRFTRNLREGLNLLESLRGHGVGLLPLDWQRQAPINVDDDRDWQDVVDEFTAAERERRRIRRRILRYYEERRARGAITANRAPFGLVREGERFVADPTRAWVVQEADKRVLAGVTYREVLEYATAADEGAWRTLSGLKRALENEAYVRAGVRTPQTHRALAQHLEAMRSRHGQRRKHPHEFAGVFACGRCVEEGIPIERSLMSGIGRSPAQLSAKGTRYDPFPNIQCVRRNNKTVVPGARRAEMTRHSFQVAESKVREAWLQYVGALSAPATLKRWSAATTDDAKHIERRLLGRLAELDRKAASLKKRRDSAFDLLSDRNAQAARQARKMLGEVETDEMELALQREVILGELARVPVKTRDAEQLRDALANFRAVYEKADGHTRNALNRALCNAIGSHPRVYREDASKGRWSSITVRWPEIDALVVAKVHRAISAQRQSSQAAQSGRRSRTARK